MKKLLKIILLLIVIIPIAYSLIFLTQNYSIKKSFESHIDGKIGNYNDDWIRCNWDITNIEIAYPFMDGKTGHVSFYEPKRIFWATSNDWDNARTGGTTVKNTTFPELVKMVKEDCYQFQEGHGDYYGEDLAWSYSPYTPEPEKTPEEIAEEEYERWLIDAIDEMREENKE